MKDIEKLKKQLKEDNSFREKFKNVKDADEAILLAEKLGYKVTKEELAQDEELNVDLLEAVSGGSTKHEENIRELKGGNYAVAPGSSIEIK